MLPYFLRKAFIKEATQKYGVSQHHANLFYIFTKNFYQNDGIFMQNALEIVVHKELGQNQIMAQEEHFLLPPPAPK